MPYSKTHKTKAAPSKKAKPGKSGQHYRSAARKRTLELNEPDAVYQRKVSQDPSPASNAVKSRIRAIGNSNGVILNNQLLKQAGIDTGADIIAFAEEGKIIIMQAKESGINTDVSTWDGIFKAAKKKGNKPEGDLFEGLHNDFDKEW